MPRCISVISQFAPLFSACGSAKVASWYIGVISHCRLKQELLHASPSQRHRVAPRDNKRNENVAADSQPPYTELLVHTMHRREWKQNHLMINAVNDLVYELTLYLHKQRLYIWHLKANVLSLDILWITVSFNVNNASVIKQSPVAALNQWQISVYKLSVFNCNLAGLRTIMSVCPIVRPSACQTLFLLYTCHRIIMKFSRIIPLKTLMSMQKGSTSEVRVQVHRGQDPILSFPDSNCSLNSHLALKWSTKLCVVAERCPIVLKVIYQISRSHSFQIIAFDQNMVFPDCYSSLISPMATKWCAKQRRGA